MEVRTLQYFLAVAEERSFTRAAARCHVAQPAISRQIRGLERELGEALFERDSRTVRLSAAGEALLPHARTVTGAVAAARAEFAARSGLLTGNLSLGAADGVEHSSLPARLGAFHRQYPGVNVHLVDGTSASLVPQVRQGSLDAAFVAVPPGGLDPDFDHRILVRDEIVAVVPADRPEAGRPELGLGQLADTPLITYGPDSGLRPHLSAAFDRAGVPFRPAYATNHVALQIELVAAGVGIALAAAAARGAAADPRVTAVPLNPRVPYAKALIWRPGPHTSAPLRALLSTPDPDRP
ncbi:LysR family transcriptional regulator [Streptomyces humi]|uniref:LysR family transcriptional regulator n=1 Tax=Streptomyces humi TaxID=1428620 RepID=UPI000628764C|nr:LysR family transcriptional regulator [Streptomyces humi]